MNKLPVREKIGYAFGDFACCLIWQSLSVYVLYYFTNVAGVENAAAVAIISVTKLLDGVSDILMGFLIDRTRSRWGKVRPYLLTMGLPLAVSTVLMFSVPASFSTQGKLIWIFVFYNLVTTVFYTALNVPYSSMHCFLTDDSRQRSMLAVLRLVFAYAAQVLINASVFFLVRKLGGGDVNDQAGWTRAYIVIGAAAFGLTLFTFFNTRERVTGTGTVSAVTVRASLVSILRNRYLLVLLAATLSAFMASAMANGAAAYFAQFVLKNVETTGLITNAMSAAQMLGLIFIVPALVRRFSKHAIYQGATVLLAASYLINGLFPDVLPVLLGLNAMKGLAVGATGAMLYGMCADAIDYGEYKTGVNSAGLGTAVLQCMGKFGMGLGTAMLGLILQRGGFSALAEAQTPSGLNAVIASYTYIPGLFVALAFLIAMAYRLEGEYPRIAEELKRRRQAAGDGR